MQNTYNIAPGSRIIWYSNTILKTAGRRGLPTQLSLEYNQQTQKQSSSDQLLGHLRTDKLFLHLSNIIISFEKFNNS